MGFSVLGNQREVAIVNLQETIIVSII